MQAVRVWALRFCVCCLLAGILQMLLPAKQQNRVIKTVLALYILLAVLSAGQAAPLDWSDFYQAAHTAVEPTELFDTKALATQEIENAMEQELTAALQAEGVAGRVQVTAALEPDTGGLADAEIVVTVPVGKEEIAQAVLEKKLNGFGRVEVHSAAPGGNADEAA